MGQHDNEKTAPADMTSFIILCLETFGRIAKRQTLRSIYVSKGVILTLRINMETIRQSRSPMPRIGLVGQPRCRSKIKCDLCTPVKMEVSLHAAGITRQIFPLASEH